MISLIRGVLIRRMWKTKAYVGNAIIDTQKDDLIVFILVDDKF